MLAGTRKSGRQRRRPPWPFALNKESSRAKGLVGWWPMVGGGTVFDLGRSKANVMTRTGTTKYQPSMLGGGQNLLDGSTGYLSCVAPSPFFVGGDMTFAAWVRTGTIPNTSGEYAGLVALGAFNDMIASLSLKDSGGSTPENIWVWEVQNSGASYQNTGGSATAAANTLYRVLGTMSNGTITLYINGLLSSSAAYTGTPKNASASYSLFLGRDFYDNSAGRWFNGALIECAVWNRGFTAAEAWADFDPRTRWDLYAEPRRSAWATSGSTTFNSGRAYGATKGVVGTGVLA